MLPIFSVVCGQSFCAGCKLGPVRGQKRTVTKALSRNPDQQDAYEVPKISLRLPFMLGHFEDAQWTFRPCAPGADR